MLEKLSSHELEGFLRGINTYQEASSPYFEGWPLGEVLDYLVDTPNEFDPDEGDWLDLCEDRRAARLALAVAEFVLEGGGGDTGVPYGATDLAEVLLG